MKWITSMADSYRLKGATACAIHDGRNATLDGRWRPPPDARRSGMTRLRSSLAAIFRCCELTTVFGQ